MGGRMGLDNLLHCDYNLAVRRQAEYALSVLGWQQSAVQTPPPWPDTSAAQSYQPTAPVVPDQPNTTPPVSISHHQQLGCTDTAPSVGTHPTHIASHHLLVDMVSRTSQGRYTGAASVNGLYGCGY